MTIKDISALTGYSVGTVSRVLNNQPNVSEKARSVILEAARSTGFQLNTNAKQLKQQHSNTILTGKRYIQPAFWRPCGSPSSLHGGLSLCPCR